MHPCHAASNGALLCVGGCAGCRLKDELSTSPKENASLRGTLHVVRPRPCARATQKPATTGKIESREARSTIAAGATGSQAKVEGSGNRPQYDNRRRHVTTMCVVGAGLYNRRFFPPPSGHVNCPDAHHACSAASCRRSAPYPRGGRCLDRCLRRPLRGETCSHRSGSRLLGVFCADATGSLLW